MSWDSSIREQTCRQLWRDRTAEGAAAANIAAREAAEVLVWLLAFPDVTMLNAVDDLLAAGTATQAKPRFAHRARSLRALIGDSMLVWPRVDYASPDDELAGVREACQRLVSWVEKLSPLSARHVPDAPRSMTASDAADAMAQWAAQRPGGQVASTVLPCTVPRELIWRAWGLEPRTGEPLLLFPAREVSVRRMAVWYGLHNGSHLDLLAHTPSGDRVALTFGRGAVVAEACAMAVELLSLSRASRCANEALATELQTGILERVARVDAALISGITERTPDVDLQSSQPEFEGLPTLRAAYTSEPLVLAGGDFEDRVLPSRYSALLRDAWREECSVGPLDCL